MNFTRIIIFIISLVSIQQTVVAQCATTAHSNNAKDGWRSCMTSANPNPERGASHWIHYDFGYFYKIGNSHVWNANEFENTGIGIKEAVIDYSTDNQNWTELGTFSFDEAPGTNDYEGFSGPDFQNITARYVLITVLSTWDNGNCAGLAEMKFDVEGVVAIEAVDKEIGRLLVSPNPAEDILRIKIEDFHAREIIIHNVSGNEMQRMAINELNVNIDVSGLMNGFYTVTIVDNLNNRIVEKFTKVN